ncbi:MAG: hypothetical protein ACRDNI_00950 [Gaiellaceae bacterium]
MTEEQGQELLEAETEEAEDEALAGPAPASFTPPTASPASGLYRCDFALGHTKASLGPVPAGIRPIRREVLRLDVDGRYPQMTVSGTIGGFLVSQVHWIAELTKVGPSRWTGAIWYKDGAVVSFPYTQVEVKAIRSIFAGARLAKVTFSGGGAPKRKVLYRFSSPHFRTVNFEFDWAEGKAASTSIDTCAHPNRPATLPCETLTIQKVFRRAGCRVTTSPGGPVSLGKAGPDAEWSDLEMHDAMQTYWTHFAAKAQWAMWVFFAALHESGTGLGGVMFDDIGPNHRQGTALFVDSFIAEPPPGDPDPAAWIERNRFWTAVHEMGHAFNLAHSWQKSLGPPFGIPWIPLADEPLARSFMNYPYAVGETAFFGDFEFRFSDQELLFVRHAPERFVQMGNANWFDHHGFEEANVSADPALKLEVRVNRERATFEFMEPIVLELKLKNVSKNPVLVDADVLDADALTLILKKEGKEARQLIPFRQKCVQPKTIALQPGTSLYGYVLASVGINGWDAADPGTYWIQAAARVGEEDVVSAPFGLRIAPPASREEEFLAGDLFTEDAARVLTFAGSRVLDRGNAVLQEIVERLPDRRIALHARYALGNPLTLEYKELSIKDDKLAVKVKTPKLDDAKELYSEALLEQGEVAAETLGHIRYRRAVERIAQRLANAGDTGAAVDSLDVLHDTLEQRTVDDRPVKPEVLAEIEDLKKELGAGTKAKARR